MKRIFLDANIVLDLLDGERPGHADALLLEKSVESSQSICMCAWHTLSIVAYVGSKVYGKEEIHLLLRELLVSWTVPDTGTEEARKAFMYLSGDYEDAMQIASAVAGRADYLVTRDMDGFSKSPVKIVSPRELCEELKG